MFNIPTYLLLKETKWFGTHYFKLLLFNVILCTTYMFDFVMFYSFRTILHINKVLYVTRQVCSEVSDVGVSLDLRRELSN